MNEKQTAGAVVALGCMFILVMYILSPAFRLYYNGMAFGLTVLASLGIMLPPLIKGRHIRRGASDDITDIQPSSHARAADKPSRTAAIIKLKERAGLLGFITPEGGVYDALILLSRRNPYAALSGAYATITLLLNACATPGSTAPSDYEPGMAIASLVRRKRMPRGEAALLTDIIDELDTHCSPSPPGADTTDTNNLLDITLGAIAFLERIS